MIGPRCSRSWEVEAARDGRLGARQVAELQLHVTSCTDCTREREALTALGEALQASAPAVAPAELQALRARVLSNAAARSARPSRSPLLTPTPLQVRVALLLAAGVTGVGLLLVQPRLRSVAPAAAPNPAPATLVITAGPQGARWSRQHGAASDDIVLSDGSLTIDVRQHTGQPRAHVRVHTPDGLLQDLGTVFRVTVQADRTSEIVVDQGRVLFARRGAAPLTLTAPARWALPVQAVLQDAAHVASEPVAMPASERVSAAADRRVAKTAPHAARQAPQEPAVHTDAADDESAEDAAYLQLIALWREGRADEARLAAARYLKSFPSGFRRKEVAATLADH